ncbi:MAG: hypothetical protein NTV58_19410 [Deltaproteobacteria bacterium]|nr:hypothetical protein [Deltaproteobacteria bacterium]
MTKTGGGSGKIGAVFKINITGSGYTNLHTFGGGANDGLWPFDSLTISGSTLYGMTEQGGVAGEGVIFKMNVQVVWVLRTGDRDL